MSGLGIQIKHEITGEQIGDTIEMGDKTLGELFEELLPRILKKDAVLDWKKLFYEKCEVIVSLQVENERYRKYLYDKDYECEEQRERADYNEKEISQLTKENEKLKKEIMDKQITDEFTHDFLAAPGAGEEDQPVQKEDIDQFCEDFEYDDEKKQMLYSEFNCCDSDEE